MFFPVSKDIILVNSTVTGCCNSAKCDQAGCQYSDLVKIFKFPTPLSYLLTDILLKDQKGKYSTQYFCLFPKLTI